MVWGATSGLLAGGRPPVLVVIPPKMGVYNGLMVDLTATGPTPIGTVPIATNPHRPQKREEKQDMTSPHKASGGGACYCAGRAVTVVNHVPLCRAHAYAAIWEGLTGDLPIGTVPKLPPAVGAPGALAKGHTPTVGVKVQPEPSLPKSKSWVTALTVNACDTTRRWPCNS